MEWHSKGVFIPNEIYNRRDISPICKLLFSEIWHLSNGKHGCIASNKWFAERLGIHESNVSAHLSHLKNLNLIEVVNFNGRTRELKANISIVVGLPKSEVCLTETGNVPYRNRLGSNISKQEVNKEIYIKVIDHLNKMTGQKFKVTDYIKRLLNGRIREGYSLKDFLLVIDKQVARWKGTEYAVYLRPSTLFRPSKFDGYLNADVNTYDNRDDKVSQKWLI